MAIVKEVDSRADAIYNIHAVANRGDADLFVCKVDSRGDALRDEGCWNFTEAFSEADFTVCFLESRANADFIICYVESRGEAGWRSEHPLTGKLVMND